MSVPGGPYPFVNPHNIARYVLAHEESLEASMKNLLSVSLSFKLSWSLFKEEQPSILILLTEHLNIAYSIA